MEQEVSLTPSTLSSIKISVDVDLNLFSLEAVKSACYRLADIGSASLASVTNNVNSVHVIFSLPNAYNDADRAKFLDDFNTELIDHDLRIRIRKETEVSRNLILAYAFSDSKLMDE